MAFHNIPADDAAAVQLYEKLYFQSKYYTTDLGVAQEMDCVYNPPEFKQRAPGAGDTVNINTFGRIGGLGFTENNTIEGNEQDLNRSNFSMSFNETWQAVRVPSRQNVKQMRLRTDLQLPAVDAIFDWQTSRANISFMQQAAGAYPTSLTFDGETYTGSSRSIVTGHNTVTAPASGRVYRAAAAATDQALSSADTMTTDLLDDISARIVNSLPTFKKGKDGKILGFLSPRQMLDLRRDAGGSITWYANALAYANGGDADDLRMGTQFGRTGYVYNNFVLFESPYVASGVDSGTSAIIPTVKRAVFLGGDALFYASPFGGTLDDDEVPLTLVTETFDYKRFDGYAACNTSGIKTFVGADGVADNVFVVPTYAATF